MPLRTKFRIPPTGLLSIFDNETAGHGRVELDNALFAGNGEWFEYLTATAESQVSEATLASRDIISRVDSELIEPEAPTRSFLVLVEEPTPFIVTTLTESQAVPHRVFLEHGAVTVIASVQDWTHLKDLAKIIEEEYTRFELLGTTQVQGIGYPLGSEQLQFTIRGKLSAEQLDALRVAYEMGFFEIPQEVNGKEVADRLDISQSAVSEKLRRAHKNLCEFLFGKRDGEPRTPEVE